MGFLSAYDGTKRVIVDEARGYWIDLKKHVSQGDKEISERALVTMTIHDGKPVVNPDVTSYRQALVLAHIAAWNLDDDAGVIWPVTSDNIKRLPGDVFDELWTEVDTLSKPRNAEERLQFRDGDVVSD